MQSTVLLGAAGCAVGQWQVHNAYSGMRRTSDTPRQVSVSE